MRTAVAVLLAAFALTAPARAANVCAWMLETNGGDEGNVRHLEIWLESDAGVDFLYKIGGKGIVSESMTGNSPSSGTFVLHAGQKEKPWGFGATLYPPGSIDVTITLHKMPADIFSDEETPILASYAFARKVPESETNPPATLARKQCKPVNP
jgi:hypothetical protein